MIPKSARSLYLIPLFALCAINGESQLVEVHAVPNDSRDQARELLLAEPICPSEFQPGPPRPMLDQDLEKVIVGLESLLENSKGRSLSMGDFEALESLPMIKKEDAVYCIDYMEQNIKWFNSFMKKPFINDLRLIVDDVYGDGKLENKVTWGTKLFGYYLGLFPKERKELIEHTVDALKSRRQPFVGPILVAGK